MWWLQKYYSKSIKMSQPSLKKTKENNVVGTIITEVMAIKYNSSAA